jgi:hypothetical protein
VTYRQRRKLVRRRLALRMRDLAQQRALAHTRESDQRHSRIARFLDVEPHTGRTGLGGGLEQLGAVACELGFEEAQVVFGGLLRGVSVSVREVGRPRLGKWDLVLLR